MVAGSEWAIQIKELRVPFKFILMNLYSTRRVEMMVETSKTYPARHGSCLRMQCIFRDNFTSRFSQIFAFMLSLLFFSLAQVLTAGPWCPLWHNMYQNTMYDPSAPIKLADGTWHMVKCFFFFQRPPPHIPSAFLSQEAGTSILILPLKRVSSTSVSVPFTPGSRSPSPASPHPVFLFHRCGSFQMVVVAGATTPRQTFSTGRSIRRFRNSVRISASNI